MLKPVPDHHPLRRLFSNLSEEAFVKKLKWRDINVSNYVANLLTEFSHIDRLYQIKNIMGERLEDVASMLLEADILLNASSAEREREVYRHIGDLTLFMVGIFPEFLRRIHLEQWIHHPDFLIDYMKVGKHSYRNVSEFNYGEFRESVPLFRKLSENFEICVMGMAIIRDHIRQLPALQNPFPIPTNSN